MAEQAQIIRWETPPPPALRGRGGGRGAGPSRHTPRPAPGSRYTGVAAELRARPGEYAVIAEQKHASGLASKINLGRILCFQPAGHYEGTARRFGEITAIYARYLGDGEAS